MLYFIVREVNIWPTSFGKDDTENRTPIRVKILNCSEKQISLPGIN